MDSDISAAGNLGRLDLLRLLGVLKAIQTMQRQDLDQDRFMSGLPGWLSGKESAYNGGTTGNVGLIPRSGRSPGGGHGNPLQYSYLENPMDRGVWWATLISGFAGNSEASPRDRSSAWWDPKEVIFSLVFSISFAVKWKQELLWRDFPGGAVAKTELPMLGAWVWALVKELDPTYHN